MRKNRKANPLTASLKNVRNVRLVLEALNERARKMTDAKPFALINKTELLHYTDAPIRLLKITDRHLGRLLKGGCS